MRNESEGKRFRLLRCDPQGATSTDQSLVKDLSKSISVGSKAMVHSVAVSTVKVNFPM
jgi:hypothetical protein